MASVVQEQVKDRLLKSYRRQSGIVLSIKGIMTPEVDTVTAPF